MNIARTTDIDFIVKCVHGAWDCLTDDGSPIKELYFPPLGENATWVRVEDYGVFLLTRMNLILYEVHTALLPAAKGMAVDIGKEALVWAFANTEAKRIITSVPVNNPLALRFAKAVGFIQYGVNEKSFQKDGELIDQIMLGVSKGEETCQ